MSPLVLQQDKCRKAVHRGKRNISLKVQNKNLLPWLTVDLEGIINLARQSEAVEFIMCTYRSTKNWDVDYAFFLVQSFYNSYLPSEIKFQLNLG